MQLQTKLLTSTIMKNMFLYGALWDSLVAIVNIFILHPLYFPGTECEPAYIRGNVMPILILLVLHMILNRGPIKLTQTQS